MAVMLVHTQADGCGHDYGGDRFGGTSPSIVNEREDITVMATFNSYF